MYCSFAGRSIPQEDSDYERERTPPTPPPRKPARRSGASSFKLACIGKQNSDEVPMMRKNIAAPLKLAQAQVSVT